MKKRRRRWRVVVYLLLLVVVSINGIAFVQAWSMTHVVAGGLRTNVPEKLSTAGKLWVLLTGVHIPARRIFFRLPIFNFRFKPAMYRINKLIWKYGRFLFR